MALTEVRDHVIQVGLLFSWLLMLQLLAMYEEITVEDVMKLVSTHLQPHKGIKGAVSIIWTDFVLS